VDILSTARPSLRLYSHLTIRGSLDHPLARNQAQHKVKKGPLLRRRMRGVHNWWRIRMRRTIIIYGMMQGTGCIATRTSLSRAVIIRCTCIMNDQGVETLPWKIVIAIHSIAMSSHSGWWMLRQRWLHACRSSCAPV